MDEDEVEQVVDFEETHAPGGPRTPVTPPPKKTRTGRGRGREREREKEREKERERERKREEERGRERKREEERGRERKRETILDVVFWFQGVLQQLWIDVSVRCLHAERHSESASKPGVAAIAGETEKTKRHGVAVRSLVYETCGRLGGECTKLLRDLVTTAAANGQCSPHAVGRWRTGWSECCFRTCGRWDPELQSALQLSLLCCRQSRVCTDSFRGACNAIIM